MDKNANSPAFPCVLKENRSSDPLATPRPVEYSGMTLRDYFAGQALAGLLCGDPDTNFRDSAKWAYAHADEMLAARKGGETDAPKGGA